MSQLGIITTFLEEEVKRELRQHGIVVWLDKDGHYTAYVDQLVERHAQGDFFAPVIPFRGSYLEMILALENYGNGLDPERLIIHMPGHTEETIRKTPMLELYRAGYRFRKALTTLIREAASGRVGPAEIENYLSREVSDLATAEAWLQEAMSQPKEGLAGELKNFKPEELLNRLLIQDKDLESKVIDEAALNTLVDYFYRHTGIDRAFVDFFLSGERLSYQNLGNALAGWLMCVEYVHDLQRPPHLEELQPLSRLSKPLQDTCDRLIAYLRQQHEQIYIEQSDYTESRLQRELDAMTPEDLGQLDTFRWEEIRVLESAVQALLAANWEKALNWATSRTETESFWLQRDRARQLVWSLVRNGATLGQALKNAGRPLKNLHSLREVLDYYTEIGYEIDKLHRHFEQQRFKLLDTTLPHYAELREAAIQLRKHYRVWADTLAEDFAKICTSEGFLPDKDLQQRTLYDQVVHPLTQGNAKVAYFIIDAFRYEMATELLPEFAGTGTTVHLQARYCELPTITAIGMNALAPVHQSGRLVLAGSKDFNGFKTGEYTVRKPDERVRAMGEKSVNNRSTGRKNARGITLSNVCNWSTTSLKKSCADADLIVVHSQEIDDAGEANIGLATFETWLQQIKSAWNHLKSIGVKEFVFTADHGFLLQDETTQEKPYGSKRDPNRRYVLSEEQRLEEGMVAVSLSALNYEGQDGYLLFRKDTAVFDTGNRGATFVHGGNSLQERVIPVLTVSQRLPTSTGVAKYIIEAEVKSEVLTYSRIALRVKPAPVALGGLTFVGADTVTLALRVRDRSDIQVTVRDAPGIEVKNQQLLLKVEADWAEVFFDLKGDRDERVRVEVFHPDAIEDIDPIILPAYFNVSGSSVGETTPTKEAATEAVRETDWKESFEDPAIMSVFLHLQQHGSLTEEELSQMLGNPRQARRFSRDFEQYVEKVPFSVRIETTTSGKRYVKQN
jgi:hypothetical protein